MAMAISGLGGFGGGQSGNAMLLRSDMGSSNSLVALLNSCNPHCNFPVARSGGGLEDAVAGCGQKRPLFHAAFDRSPADGEADDDAEGGDELSHGGGPVEKKRRLSFDQVRALERNFEVENKLEPERKMLLAKELGLQPRQVAVWFQNRRARWKTKQLERDYEMLNCGYLKLKADFETAVREKDVLSAEVRRLSGKSSSSHDSQSVDSSQCDSEAGEASRRGSASAAASAEIRGQEAREPAEAVKEATSSGSSELVDAESPRTSDSGRRRQQQQQQQHQQQQEQELWRCGEGYKASNRVGADSGFRVGPEASAGEAVPVKLEGGGAEDGFSADPSCGYFLPSMMVEPQGVLPWWDWA